MATEVRLPQLGETMEEGTIIDLTVKVGDRVKKGDIIFEIETDKATLEVQSPADGFVKYIITDIDQTLLVGQPVMVLGEKDEQIPRKLIDSLKKEIPAASPQPQNNPAKPASSITNKISADDLATITAAGPAGEAIDLAKIKLGATIPLNKFQKLTAQRMLNSKRQIPCFYLNVRADVTDMVELRTKLNRTGNADISYNDFIIRAVAIALQKFPIMTGRLEGDIIKLAEQINIGLAVAAPNGLIVPVVKGADKKDLKQIAADTKALAQKAETGKLLLTDLEAACITISNLGALGIEFFIPIVIPGQCSIIGIGQIIDSCVPDDGKGDVRKLMNLTISVDHRIANGTYAAQFIDLIKKLLEDPAKLA